MSAPGSVLQTLDRGILLLSAGHLGENQSGPSPPPMVQGDGWRGEPVGACLTLEDTRAKG